MASMGFSMVSFFSMYGFLVFLWFLWVFVFSMVSMGFRFFYGFYGLSRDFSMGFSMVSMAFLGSKMVGTGVFLEG